MKYLMLEEVYRDSFGLSNEFYKQSAPVVLIGIPVILLVMYLMWKQDDEEFVEKTNWYLSAFWKLTKKVFCFTVLLLFGICFKIYTVIEDFFKIPETAEKKGEVVNVKNFK